ncbi:MAG: right-handed parallel beta-helix repeat-containing protein [Actinobacteria bacterium]|nr:right-handed parallel beta-helix repeat-containing protein [Actinomycetota bacterium]
MATPASAATQVITSCGTHVMLPARLANNLNCGGNTYGLHVAGSSGSGVLNLDGHTISGNGAANATATEYVGIFLEGARGVTVRNGTVTGFDAGVAITRGGQNVVMDMNVHDNINHSSLNNAPAAQTNRCRYGDGIVITGSSRNVIKNNVAEHNGPFDGIGIVGNSDDNIVDGNLAINQTVSNVLLPPFPPDNPEGLGPCGPFQASGPGVGRPNQDIGIRVEGPGADRNRVAANRVFDNQLNGISIHGWVCHAGPGNPPPPGAASNNDNVIEANNVRRNGFADVAAGEIQDGIGVLQQGPLGIITCPSSNNDIIGNTVINNARHGIFVSSMSSNNDIHRNLVNNNGADGIRLNGPFSRDGQNFPGATNNRLTVNTGRGNGEHDAHDVNRRCDQNFWNNNVFDTVFRGCEH